MIAGDFPIDGPEDDALGRAGIASSFADHVLALDASRGLVVGVLGPWGSGKTSFVNLARARLVEAGAVVLEFNPWMFSGAEQLVESFFVELAAQLRIRPGLTDVGKDLEDYGETFSGMGWLPLVGPWIERGRGGAKLLGKILQRRKQGVGGRREKLVAALDALERPIVVVLDDIDRLSTAEIRDVFRLIRLTASFPNVIYLVAFDRARVEQALTDESVVGRDYLEKILQVAIDLPSIPSEVLSREFLSAIDAALAEVESTGPFDEMVWPDVYAELIRPLVRNMRDVRRYTAVLPWTVSSLEGQVALADVLGLEAIRVFLPDVFAMLHRSVEGLTTVSGVFRGGGGDSPELKQQVDRLVGASGEHGDIVRALIERLFPAAQRHLGGSNYGSDWRGLWLSERRVAHEDVLRFYLERAAGAGLSAFTDAERAFSYFGDAAALDDSLRSVDPARVVDVVASLESFQDRFDSAHVVPASVVLLNLVADFPERPRGMYEFDSGLVTDRVVLRLLRSLATPEEVDAAVGKTLPQLSSLSAKLDLLRLVGHAEGVGHGLIPAAAAEARQASWRDEVRAAPPEAILAEHDLLKVLLRVKRDADPSEPPLVVADTPEMTWAILNSARNEVRGNVMGNRAVTRSARLHWDTLVDIIGDEHELGERIQRLKATGVEDPEGLITLAEKYLGGWRPEDR